MKRIYKILFLIFLSSYVFSITPEKINAGSVGFIENKGQIHDQNNNPNPYVKYLLCTPGMNIQLKKNSFSYDTYVIEEKQMALTRISRPDKLKLPETENIFHFHRVDVEFIGANSNPEIISENPSETYFNYYTSGTDEQGAHNIRSFSKITYKNLYPNVDLEFITQNGKLKYNFILHSGSDINLIKWKYHGANSNGIKNQNIEIEVKQGRFVETIPESYIKSFGKHKKVKVNFISLDDNTFGFNKKFASKPNETLVIDPTPNVLWATYFGGALQEWLNGVCTDATGNAYITGYTKSSSSIATIGSFQPVFGGGTLADAVILKFNSSGSLAWATYFGRGGDDQGISITLDKLNNVIVSGQTSSGSMSTAGCHQLNYGGGTYDAFLIKFNNSGSRLWSTYYGGTSYDDSYGCSVDSAGNIFMTGNTTSTNSISTSGSYQTAFAGGPYDAYITKFTPNGVRLWATYYGDSGDDQATACVNDLGGNLYLASCSTSSVGISTPGSHQFGYGGSYDGYLVKFNTNGVRKWCTYYGGSGQDLFSSLIYDSINHMLYACGSTASNDSIASPSSHQSIYGGAQDGFLVKFDTNGVRQWGTYYGAAGADYGFGITIDSANIYLGGTTVSTSSIATSGALQTSYAGGPNDGFIAKFNKNGIRQWGTYYGFGNYDLGLAIAATLIGDLYLIGVTYSTGLATSGAYQVSINGAIEGFCTKFSQSISTGIISEQIENEYLNIFPNPNNGSFTIQSKENMVLEIINEIGQTVNTIKLNESNNKQYTVSNLATGIYCILNKENGNAIQNKIVVTK